MQIARFNYIKQKLGFLLAIMLAAVVGGLTTNLVRASIPNSSGTITACYRNEGGELHVIDADNSEVCSNQETALNWSQAANNGMPFTCPGCQLTGADSYFSGKNLSGAYLYSATILNLSDSNLTGANLSYSNIENSNLEGANFTSANLMGAQASDADFNNANLTNANLTSANLRDAENMDTAAITGVTWNNTTCPDETNSDNNSNTCVGHLIP